MFRTEFEIAEFNYKISTKSKLMFFGSCFTENIGEKIANLHLQNNINPFGILYNPASVSENIRLLIENKNFTEKDLNQNNNKWFSYNHHGKFSDEDKDKCLQNINTEINKASSSLKDANFLFITFGTSWVYKLKENNKIVANCHRIPAKEFNRERLTITEIVDDYKKLITKIKNINPNIKIVFTVSPIRHWKDGANGNQLSKSVLLLAIEEIIKQNTNCFYFPSYEIIMDDLRDYRFYSSDMLHINDIAINYIWEKFTNTFFDNSTLEYAKKINKINSALNHRTENNKTEKYIEFINSNIAKTKTLETEYNIDLSDLVREFREKV